MFRPGFFGFISCTLVLCFGSALGAAELTELEPVEVVGDSRGWIPSGVFIGERLARADLAHAPQQQLDDILRGVPGFRLYRRSGSAVAHPTTQGANLRSVGPSGASRSLVLRDGIPINDPFGGWVYWSRYPASTMSGVSVIHDGGVNPWGQMSLGGTISLETRFQEDSDLTTAEIVSGEHVDVGLQGMLSREITSGTRVCAGASVGQHPGYSIIKESQAGPIDVPAELEYGSVDVGIRHALSDRWIVGAEFGYFDEERVNGTPATGSSVEAADFSVRLMEADASGWQTEWILYAQDREFESRFSRVDDDRSGERLVLDQYDVPSDALGFIQRGQLALNDAHTLHAGVDVRRVSGMTHERYRNLGDGFTRQREAGGEQWSGGVHVSDDWAAAERLRIHGSVRLDYSVNDGERQESDLATGEVLLDEVFDDETYARVGYRLASEWQASDALVWRNSLYRGYRQPTLNELYRPFRVGNDITEANPELEPEQIDGLATSVEADVMPGLRLGGTIFYHMLSEAIANVTLTSESGFAEPWGFISAGGSGRQRLNLDRVDVLGLECAADWLVLEGVSVSARYLYNDAEVRDAGPYDALEGTVPAQMPEHQASLGFRLRRGIVYLAIDGRWADQVYEDDLNQRELDAYATVDARVDLRIKEHATLFVSVENAFDEEIETRRTADGLVSVGVPQSWRVRVRVEW